MPSQIILNMHQVYPFGTHYIAEKKNQEVFVRKLVFRGNKEQLYCRIKFFQKLKIPHTVKIISVFSHQKSIEIYYEYVRIKFEIWMKNMSVELQQNLQKQLYAISEFLATNRISTKFNPEQIGLDNNYHIKYFINVENSFHDVRSSPQQLKEIFDREIQAFLKSTNSRSHKIKGKGQNLGSQLKLTKQLQKSHREKMYRNLDRTFSVKTVNLKHNQLTKASSNQFQSEASLKTSVPTLNKLQIPSFSYKINDIKERFYMLKEKGTKMNRSAMDISYESKKSKQTQSDNALLQKKTLNQTKTNKTVSFEHDIENAEQSPKLMKKPMQHHSQNSEKNSLLVLNEDKKIKSQKLKTSKHSEKPIEYLDMVRSPSAYVLDFLNVLEDPSQSEKQDQGDKITEEQQLSNKPKDGLAWKNKVNKVIENSRNLISRLRPPSKLVLN